MIWIGPGCIKGPGWGTVGGFGFNYVECRLVHDKKLLLYNSG